MTYSLSGRILRAVKAAGVRYRTVSGWQSRGHGTMGTVQSVIAHHTAGPSKGNAPSLNVVAYGRTGLRGPLAQLFLARDGTVIVVAAGVSWHAGVVDSSRHQNSHAIGIEAEATGRDSWPAEQMEAYAKLCKALIDEFHLPISEVQGHKEVACPKGRKPDPNFSMPDFRRKIGGASGGVSVSKPSASKPKWTKISGATPTAGRWDYGEPVGRIQKAVGVEADDYFGSDTRAAVMDYQRRHGLAVDGVVGKETWAKINSGATAKPKPPRKSQKAPKFPLKKGHAYGTESRSSKIHSGFYARDRGGIRKFQTQLKKRGWRISVDGRYGAETKKVVLAFQKERRSLTNDGLVGPATWAAIWESSII